MTLSKWNHAHAIRNGINAPPTEAAPSYGWFSHGSLTCGFAVLIASRNTHAWRLNEL